MILATAQQEKQSSRVALLVDVSQTALLHMTVLMPRRVQLASSAPQLLILRQVRIVTTHITSACCLELRLEDNPEYPCRADTRPS